MITCVDLELELRRSGDSIRAISNPDADELSKTPSLLSDDQARANGMCSTAARVSLQVEP